MLLIAQPEAATDPGCKQILERDSETPMCKESCPSERPPQANFLDNTGVKSRAESWPHLVNKGNKETDQHQESNRAKDIK